MRSGNGREGVIFLVIFGSCYFSGEFICKDFCGIYFFLKLLGGVEYKFRFVKKCYR